MAVDVNSVVSQMRQALLLSEPDLDTTVGTTVRKILDAVGEMVAESYVDRYLLDYQYDVDSKQGADLDDFVAQFGFTRLAARRATGTVTFERSGLADTLVIIPVGTLLGTDGAVPTSVITVVPAMLLPGDTSISVPAQALLGGAAGNVAVNALRVQQTPLMGVTSFTNQVAFTGGTDAEGDLQLRERFKRTIFRNLAGTEQMFVATALENPAVSQVNVLGASKRRREQVQVIGGTATSTIQGARYIYPNSSVFGTDLDGGAILTPGVHYTFNATVPPSITSIGAGVPDGFYDFEFEYVSTASRNDPTAGVSNRVDVYVNGESAAQANEVALWHAARVFNTTADDPLNRTNFQRLDSSQPVAGNHFLALSFAPVIDASLSDSIVIGAVTYIEGTDYWMVNDITREGGTSRSLSGIEFKSAANGQAKALPAENTAVALEYAFNTVPRDVEEAVRSWRLITTDVRVHQAKQVRLNVHMAVILDPGLALASIQPQVYARLADYISRVGFNGVVQVSDLLEVAHSVDGVDAVRMLASSEPAATGRYGLQVVSASNDVLDTNATSGRAKDLLLGDDQVPNLNMVYLVQKAQNSFGAAG